jgi:hypothetical protein
VLHRRLLRYAMAHYQQMALGLLMAHDRAGADRFPMTYQSISIMLGLRRTGLENASYGCYAAVRAGSGRLLGQISR